MLRLGSIHVRLLSIYSGLLEGFSGSCLIMGESRVIALYDMALVPVDKIEETHQDLFNRGRWLFAGERELPSTFVAGSNFDQKEFHE